MNAPNTSLELKRLVSSVLTVLETDAGENTDESMYFAVLTTCLCAGAVQSEMGLEHLLEGVRRTYHNLKTLKTKAEVPQ